MPIGENPHIVSTENTLFLDENGNVIPNPYDTGYTEPEEVSVARRIRVLERDEAELLARIEAFCEDPSFTEGQRARIREYREDERQGKAVKGLFGYRLRYRCLRKVFIEPYDGLLARLHTVRHELADFRRQYARLTK